MSDADERRLLDLAFAFHVSIEGEYGCPGPTCPGVQRLVEAFRRLKGVGMRDAVLHGSEAAPPERVSEGKEWTGPMAGFAPAETDRSTTNSGDAGGPIAEKP